jgi:hypothetical protein
VVVACPFEEFKLADEHRLQPPAFGRASSRGRDIAKADALLFGRVTCEMMEAGWRTPAPTGIEA